LDNKISRQSGKVVHASVHFHGEGRMHVSPKLKPKWSSESLALLTVFEAILLPTVTIGILYLLPFRLGINYAILVSFLLVLGVIFWWQRFNILTKIIRPLESKFGGEG
jgi:hypothetical protein